MFNLQVCMDIFSIPHEYENVKTFSTIEESRKFLQELPQWNRKNRFFRLFDCVNRKFLDFDFQYFYYVN